METAQAKVSSEQALRELWRRGKLDFILHQKQREIKADLLARTKTTNTILCARRFGKTVVLLVMAIELCINKKKAIVKYVCPEKSQGVENIQEALDFILENCPEDMRPEWKTVSSKYIFPNGSQIQVAGTDNQNYKRLRGGRADMCIIDEAGFCDDLKKVVSSVLLPTMQLTKGKLFLISTPSETPTHDFLQIYVRAAKSAGVLVKYTIYDNPLLTPARIEEIIREDYPLGTGDLDFRRECLCEVEFDAEKMVIPGFDKKKEKLVKAWERPPFYDSYTSGDVGFRDLTHYLFAYWDFMNATLVVEDELVLNGPEMTTEALANGIRAKENALWRDSDGMPKQTYKRVMDNNLIMIADLINTHKLNFMPTDKHNKEAPINLLKILINNNQVIIHPRCVHLIYQLENATWKDGSVYAKSREFDHIPDTEGKRGGHADGVDALIYLVRNLDRQRNPYPDNYNIKSGFDIFRSKHAKQESESSINFKKLFNIGNKYG